jgi:hypothetical protein
MAVLLVLLSVLSLLFCGHSIDDNQQSKKPGIVSKSGCNCAASGCVMSYVSPHHDTHFCYVDPNECEIGCECHADQPDRTGTPWDFCDPAYNTALAWSQAPPFTRHFLANHNAEATKKEDAKKDAEDVSMAKKTALAGMHQQLMSTGAVSAIVAVLAVGLAFTALSRCVPCLNTSQKLSDAVAKCQLLEQEKKFLTEAMEDAKKDKIEQQHLLVRQQNLCDEMLRSSSIMSLSGCPSRISLHDVAQSPAQFSGNSKPWATYDEYESALRRQITMNSQCSISSSQLGLHSRLESGCGERDAEPKAERLNVSPQGKKSICSIPTLTFGPRICDNNLQEGLLGDSRFKKVGEEAWTEQEVTSEHDDQKSLNSTPAATTEDSSGQREDTGEGLSQKMSPDMTDDAMSETSQRSHKSKSSTASRASAKWWGGECFLAQSQQTTLSPRLLLREDKLANSKSKDKVVYKAPVIDISTPRPEEFRQTLN